MITFLDFLALRNATITVADAGHTATFPMVLIISSISPALIGPDVVSAIP
jgi:hypothetical protein